MRIGILYQWLLFSFVFWHNHDSKIKYLINRQKSNINILHTKNRDYCFEKKMAKFQISFLRYHPVGIYESMNLKSQGKVHFHAPIGAIVFLWANNKGKMSYPLLTSVCPSALTTFSPSYFSLRWPNLTKNITVKYWTFFKESLDFFVFHGKFFSHCAFSLTINWYLTCN